MTDHVRQTIALVQEQVSKLEAELIEKKRMVNSLCSLIGQPVLYTDAELVVSKSAGPMRADAYYGQPMATAIRMILERRKAANLGPCTANEIYDSLVEGGYKFNTANEEYAKRGLYSALSKNTATFHKLPNGLYGLLEWYPGVRESKPAKTAKAVADQEEPSQVGAEDGGVDFFGPSVEAEPVIAKKPR